MRNHESASNILYSHNPNEYYIDGEAKSAENFTVIEINGGGPFYKDPYFEGYRLQFEHCVKEILKKFSIGTGRSGDVVAAYHNFRDDKLMETNHAMSHITDAEKHQIIVDVRDFMYGNIIVKSYHNMIVVEGDVIWNKQPKKFHRQFIIPGYYEISSVVSVISSDGVLTIVVPRTVPKDNTRTGHQKYQYATDAPQRRESTDYVRRMSRSPSPQLDSPPNGASSRPSYQGQSNSGSVDRTPNVREIKINTSESSDSGRSTASATPSRRGSVGNGDAYVSPRGRVSYKRNAHGGFWRDYNN